MNDAAVRQKNQSLFITLDPELISNTQNSLMAYPLKRLFLKVKPILSTQNSTTRLKWPVLTLAITRILNIPNTETRILQNIWLKRN